MSYTVNKRLPTMQDRDHKPFHNGEIYEVWIGNYKYEAVVVDGFYQESQGTGLHKRREGWRLLLCYDANYGNRKTKEKYFDEIVRINR